MPLQRSYYQATASEFLLREEAAILGELVGAHGFDVFKKFLAITFKR